MKTTIYVMLTFMLILSGCNPKEEKASHQLAEAPTAKIIPKKLEIHNDVRIDNYFWMRLSDEQKNAET